MKIIDRISSCLKSVDKQFEDLGFVKVSENDSFCAYRRFNVKYSYNQRLDIIKKKTGKHIIQSYEEEPNSDDFSNVVGLEEKEASLAVRKLREMRRKHKW